MKIAITGHRPNKLGNDYELKSELIENIKNEIIAQLSVLCPKGVLFEDYFTFITGMALGIDTLFARMAIFFSIPFIAAIPFKGQDRMWFLSSKRLYNQLLQEAEWIHVCDIEIGMNWDAFNVLKETDYNSAKMQKRNEWMVDNCDLLIAVWDGSTGGTNNCVQYAKSINKTIIIINPNDYK